MSKYFDRHGVQLHKDDAVRLEGVGAALEHAEGVIHSFYLMRDGKDRARVHLTGQGGRAVGVKVELLTKIHDDGPEPVFDELVPHAAAISDVLGRRFVPPGGSRRTSAAGPFGEAVDALAAALLAAFTVLDDAVRRWPPPIESTSNGGALTPRAQEVKRTMDGLKAAPPKADAMHGVDKAAALVAPMKVLSETLLEGGEKIIDAFGCYLPVERNFLDVDADGSPAGGLARVSAGSVISNAFKSAPKMARIPQEAFRYRDEALARLYPARRCVPALRPLFYESGEALRRAHAALSTPVPPSLASRVGLHKPPRASAHAREERRGGYYFYVPDDWAGPSETLPLVVALHGKESNGPAFFWRLSREASSRRFALLAPSSLGLSWGTPPPNWALPDPKRPGANADVDNVLSLLDDIHARYPIDAARTLVLGYCEGAPFALRLALTARTLAATTDDPERFGAVALLGADLDNLPLKLDEPPLRVYWALGTLDALHVYQRVRRTARELAEVQGVELVWREIERLPHIFPPPDETTRLLHWFHECMVLEGEQRIEWTLLEPSPTPAHGASADEQTGSADDGVGAPSAAAAQPPPPPPEDLPAMLERLQLTHLSKLLAAEEIDLALLRSMTNFPEELAELGASEEELRKLEAAVHPPPSAEVDDDDEDGLALEVN